MKSEKGQAQLLFIVIVIIACGVIAGIYSWAKGNMPAQTTSSDGVYMIQPNGANPQKDYSNSQTNLNNSQANNYNAQATAVIIDSNGNYIVDAARATQIVADSNQGPINAYTQGQEAGKDQATGMFGLGTIGVILAVIVLVLLFAKR